MDVTAPPGTFAVQYQNGAVEFRKLPASGRIPRTQEIEASGRAGADVGSVSDKPISRTGATFFDEKRGIDVTASEGNFLVEFEDGTIQEVPLPSGGFIPGPGQLGKGGADVSQAKSAFGPSFEELGIPDPSKPPVPIEQGGGDTGLIRSSELTLIGPEHKGKRAKKPGDLFFEAPDGTILERPEDQAQFAKQPGGGERAPKVC